MDIYIYKFLYSFLLKRKAMFMATTVTKHVGYPEQGLFMPAFLVELQLLGIVPSLSYGLIGSCSFEGWLVLKEPFQNSVWAITVSAFPTNGNVCVFIQN